MDTSFTLLRNTPLIKLSPVSSSSTLPTTSSKLVNRTSNALRASVLNAALELGLGTNGNVANWMFNDSLPEEEKEDLRSPALTYGSSATSEESTSSARYFSIPSSSSHTPSNTNENFASSGLYMVSELTAPLAADAKKSTNGSVASIAFCEVPNPPRSMTPMASLRGKLKKKRGDGYESDGGYVRETGKKKKDKGEESNGGSVDGAVEKKERAKEAKNRAKEEKMKEKKEKEENKKRKKSLVMMGKKGCADGEEVTAGYETDGPARTLCKCDSSKKVKSKTSGDAGYETDPGYLSSTPAMGKAKRFFGLGAKQPKPTPTSPTTVETEHMSLPIASRFATTLSSVPTNVSVSSKSSTEQNHATSPPLSAATTFPSVDTSRSVAASPSAFHSQMSPTNAISESRGPYTSAKIATSPSTYPGRSHERPRGMLLLGAGFGSGRSPTVTFASRVPPPPLAVSLTTSSPRTLPAISFSPTPPSTASLTHKTYRHIPSPITSNQKLSPARLSPSYPVSNDNSLDSSPSDSPVLSSLGSPFVQIASLPSPVSPAPPPVRPRFPPNDGHGHRRAASLALSPFSNSTPSSPSMLSPLPIPNSGRMRSSEQTLHPPSQRPVLSIIPSSNYIVPSPSTNPLGSPGTLAHHDMPPPGTPPAGPLPDVPSPGDLASTPTSGGGDGLFSQPIPSIQRGRESPFPARPILPSATASSEGSGVVMGLEASAKVSRYRELYESTVPRGNNVRASVSQRNEGPGIAVIEPTEDGWNDGESYDEEEQDLRDVLNRFEEARGGRRRSPLDGMPLGRSRSFEAIKNRLPGNGGRDSEDADASTDNGTSRWSGSIYSRASFLDSEKSDEVRRRFVQRVGETYEEGGRERYIPPVPRIPENYTWVLSNLSAPTRSGF